MDRIKLISELLSLDASKYSNYDYYNDAIEIVSGSNIGKVIHYDCECINDPADYLIILNNHFEQVGSDISAVSISKATDEKIIVDINNRGTNKRLTFSNEGGEGKYVSTIFYKRVNSFLKKCTNGYFVQLPTGDQSIAVIYLPIDKAKKLEKIYRKPFTVDDLVDHFRNKGEWTDKFYDCRELFFMRDRYGDTVALAAISSGYDAAYDMLHFLGTDWKLPGKDGRGPLKLARDLKNESFIEFWKKNFSIELTELDEIPTQIEKRRNEYSINDDILKIYKEIVQKVFDLFHHRRLYGEFDFDGNLIYSDSKNIVKYDREVRFNYSPYQKMFILSAIDSDNRIYKLKKGLDICAEDVVSEVNNIFHEVGS